MSSAEDRELLESQRRRASFSSWFMLGLGLTLLLSGLLIGLGNTSGEIEGSAARLVFKKLKGPIPAVLWVPTVLFCFRQFRRDRVRVRELEDRQSRDRYLRRYGDSKMSAEEAIRLSESGAGPKPPPEKQLPEGIIIRVRTAEPAMKRIKSPVRRGLPESLKTEDPEDR